MKINSIVRVKDIKSDESFKPIRGGIILYYNHPNGSTMLGMGIDRDSKEITDFGGGIKRSETFIDGSLREFNEESLGVFQDIVDKDLIEDSYAIIRKSLIIIFVKIPYEVYYEKTKVFIEKYFELCSISKSVEVVGIIWIEKNNLEKMFDYDKNNIYRLIKYVLKETREILNLLT